MMTYNLLYFTSNKDIHLTNIFISIFIFKKSFSMTLLLVLRSRICWNKMRFNLILQKNANFSEENTLFNFALS